MPEGLVEADGEEDEVGEEVSLLGGDLIMRGAEWIILMIYGKEDDKRAGSQSSVPENIQKGENWKNWQDGVDDNQRVAVEGSDVLNVNSESGKQMSQGKKLNKEDAELVVKPIAKDLVESTLGANLNSHRDMEIEQLESVMGAIRQKKKIQNDHSN